MTLKLAPVLMLLRGTRKDLMTREKREELRPVSRKDILNQLENTHTALVENSTAVDHTNELLIDILEQNKRYHEQESIWKNKWHKAKRRENIASFIILIIGVAAFALDVIQVKDFAIIGQRISEAFGQ